MRIAVIEHVDSGDYNEYIFSLIEEKAKQYNYQLKAWSNSVPAAQQKVGENAVILISLGSSSSFILNWLYKIKIPFIIKKIKVDIILDFNCIASNKIKIPQLIVAGQSFFAGDIKQLKKIEKFALKNFQSSQKIASDIIIYSNRKTNDPILINKDKLQPVPFTAPDIFRTFEWHEKIMVKAQQADNKEFFISVIEDNDEEGFVLLLRAFSKFKKWQQSSMQLLILPKYESFNEAIASKHKTYKYRDDVHLLEDIEEKEVAAVIASAYAFIHVATAKAYLFVLTVAIQCSLPVISFEDADVKEYAGDAVLFCDEKNAGALGNSIIQLYKDENLHAQLKEAASKQATNLKRKEYGDKLWELFENAVKA